jgi:Trk K+ transport system NAD-binding subunit
MTRGTSLVGKTLKESNLGQEVGVAAVGVWERGQFEPAGPATKIDENSVLMLVGSQANFEAYNDRFRTCGEAPAPAVIIGGGRVGQATARALDERKMDFRIIEVDADRVGSEYREKYVFGNASDSEVLKKAGLLEASTVIITTHDDDTNLFLTIYCRKLRPELQIICRSIRERNVSALNRAGADIVMSYNSVGANAIMNLLKDSLVVMAAEGLDLFKVTVPGVLEGKSILTSGIREQTGCSVVAVSNGNGMEIMPNPKQELSENMEILLIGDIDAEDRFLRKYGDDSGGKLNGG